MKNGANPKQEIVKEANRHRTRYSERRRVQKFFEDPSRAKDSMREECDINNIVKKHRQTGILQHVSGRTPQFGDFSEVSDYQTALNQVMAAQESFMALPASVRSRFGNDPGQFLAFVGDPNNREEAIKLGLVTPPATPTAESADPAGGVPEKEVDKRRQKAAPQAQPKEEPRE